MKICLASMAPFVGGAEVAAERLVLGLQGAGHDVLVILGKRGAVQERMENFGIKSKYSKMIFTNKWMPIQYIWARDRLRCLLRREHPDVVHSNDLTTHQIVSDAARGLGMPRICHHRFPFVGPAIDWLNKFGAEQHVFVSRALMDQMCDSSAVLGSSPRSVVYDGLPLPPRATELDRHQARLQLGLPGDRVIVSFAGQIIERKGVAELIHAWMLLGTDCRTSAELLIIGDDLQGNGVYRAEMQFLADRLRCPARFIGFQSDIGAWLTASDIAVVPSHVEPLGNATLEAMSHSLPVIGTAVGGIPEMVTHEQTGLLIPPRCPKALAAAMARLIGEKVTRQSYGNQGRLRCEERFSLQAHTYSMLDIYYKSLEVICKSTFA